MGKSGKPYCFLDFDGTLVSNERRLYQFFINNLPDGFRDVLSMQEFWALKRLGIHEVDWINSKLHLGMDTAEWNARKSEEIEEACYLALDDKFDYVDETLRRLKRSYRLILISRREDRKGLLDELQRLGLTEFFESIEILRHNEEGKGKVIRQKYGDADESSILAGDTEDDMQACMDNAVRGYLVLSGIRGRWISHRFTGQKRISIVNDIRELPDPVDAVKR